MTAPIPSIPYEVNRPAALPFRDQRAGLRAIGIVLILIGVVAALFALLTSAAVMMSQGLARSTRGGTGAGTPAGAGTMELRMVAPAVLMYGGAAAFFISAGIGSVRIKRWVRPIVLIAGWPWLVIGVIGTIWWIIFSPALTRSMNAAGTGPGSPAMPAGMETTMIVIIAAVLVVLFVAIPGLLVWFYANSHVSATLAYFDTHSTKIERVPVPILGIGVWLILFAASWSMEVFSPAVSFFGTILSGLPAIAVLAALMMTALLLAREVFHRRPAGWWGIIVLFSICGISAVTTRMRHANSEYLEVAGYPAEQVRAARAMDHSTTLGSEVLSLATAAIAIGYVIYAKRYFKSDGVTESPQEMSAAQV